MPLVEGVKRGLAAPNPEQLVVEIREEDDESAPRKLRDPKREPQNDPRVEARVRGSEFQQAETVRIRGH